MMMRALKQFDYMGRRFKPGDVFEPASDATQGLALAQLAVEIDDEPPAKKSKKRYQRSDLRAEDDE